MSTGIRITWVQILFCQFLAIWLRENDLISRSLSVFCKMMVIDSTYLRVLLRIVLALGLWWEDDSCMCMLCWWNSSVFLYNSLTFGELWASENVVDYPRWHQPVSVYIAFCSGYQGVSDPWRREVNAGCITKWVSGRTFYREKGESAFWTKNIACAKRLCGIKLFQRQKVFWIQKRPDWNTEVSKAGRSLRWDETLILKQI